MGFFSTSSRKICLYPNCNQRKEGSSFECCPDHHCAHFRTAITCFKVRTQSSTACKTHICDYGDGDCRSPIEGKDTLRCRDHRYPPSDESDAASYASSASDEGDNLSDEDERPRCSGWSDASVCSTRVPREGDACDIHSCTARGCSLPLFKRWGEACEEHRCWYESCTNLAEDPTSESHSCFEHKDIHICRCGEEVYMKGVAGPGVMCNVTVLEAGQY
jgi:hypothetical protein